MMNFAWAEKPAKLSQAKIQILTRAGDRLADQGDFQGALNKYTQAYLGVVSRIRGQEFERNVLPNIFSREDLGKEMLRLMDEEYTPEELELMDCSYKVLGLVAPKLDCKELMTQLLTEEVAGFYDPDSKKMVLIVEDGPVEDPGWLGRLLGAGPAFDKDEQKATLAHELTHALQDQLYDLNKMETPIENDDDMLLAFSAIVEGDATLLMFAEGQDEDLSDMDPESMRAAFRLMSWMMPLAGGDAYRKSPPIFRESLIFPYLQGMLFVLSQAGEGGWESVHELYSRPPESTEQILHPEKYITGSNYDSPQKVTLPDILPLVSDNWNVLGDNCIGEFQMSIMLKRVRGGSIAARGWDGDRYTVFQSDDGDLAEISVSIWDSVQDAEEFATAFLRYRKVLGSKSESPELDSEELLHGIGDEEQEVFAKNSVRMISTSQDRVFVVEGFDASTTEKVMRKMIEETTFEQKRFPVPDPSYDETSLNLDER